MDKKPSLKLAITALLLSMGISGCGGSFDGANNLDLSSGPSGVLPAFDSSTSSSSGGLPPNTSSTSSSSGELPSNTSSSSTTSSSTSSTGAIGASSSSSATSSSSSSGITSSSSSSGRYVVSSSTSSGWLNCNLSPYEYNPETEPKLAPSVENAVITSAVGDTLWLAQNGWTTTAPSVAISSSSSGGLINLNDGFSARLQENIAQTGYRIAVFGEKPTHEYAINLEAKAAEANQTISFNAITSSVINTVYPDNSKRSLLIYQNVINVDQLTDTWTEVTGKIASPDRQFGLTLAAEYGAVTYRNINVVDLGPAGSQPNTPEREAAINELRQNWNEVTNFPNFLAGNRALLRNTLIHGSNAACDAGSVDGFRFDLHVHPSIPNYRLTIELETVGESEGVITAVLNGAITTRSSTESGTVLAQKPFFEGTKQPGETFETVANFKYYPFESLTGVVTSTNGIEFLVKRIELERIYAPNGDQSNAD